MARVLIVGCGGRGRALATELLEAGHQVRGTSRSPDGVAAIGAAGCEGVLADPDRLGTLLPALPGVSVVCWLMGSADGSPDALGALHGARWGSLLERLVDSPCRGAVYEAAGSVDAALLAEGGQLARSMAATHAMPVEVVTVDPAHSGEWTQAMRAAVDAVLR